MKLAPNFKPHLAASKDAARHILQNVCVRDGMSIASDGRIMVAGINDVLDSFEPKRESALIPLPACIAATKKRPKHLSVLQNVIEIDDLTATVMIDLDTTSVFKRKTEKKDKFPNIQKVLPNHTNPVSITFSAKILKQLSDAMGEESICLTFDCDNLGQCMIVTPVKIHDRFGLLMPTRYGEKADIDLSKNKALERMKKLAKESKTITSP